MTDTATDSVRLSSSAAKRVAELRTMENNDALMLRLAVNGGGCSGFSYSFDFCEAVNGDDQSFETDGVKLVVDEVSLEFLRGAEVDYVEELIGAAFKVNNPNATAACGCGTSFNVM